VVHLEAGLRSFDRTMPEEHNRVLIDAVSELCLVPHPHNAKLLKDEGVAESRIRLTGSTLRDALEMVLPSHRERQATLGRFGLTSDRFVLATIHRVENADDESNLRTILEALAAIDLPVVLPLHPRTRARAASFGLDDLVAAVTAVEPLGYREFISLAACSALIVSDSGGVQEEACILGRPVIVVRTSTERPELLGTFAHLVPPGTAIAETAHGLLADIERTHAALAELPYPYGDDATARCVRAIGELSE
jgi:UDP-N-acetylglucosamine 2-epimerase (non-hydrolysing)